jgi:hypothetical protein
LGVLGGLFYYINLNYKSELEKFYFKVDKWGITEIGKAELQRQERITELNEKGVPFAQCEALRKRTVFFGATSEMVLLALGQPANEPVINDQGLQVWVYYFDDYTRPTHLYFTKKDDVWILSSAEKISD